MRTQRVDRGGSPTVRRRGGAGPAAVAAAVLLTAAGCSVGQGAPDGWRYVRTGAVAIALPKTWRVTADGADGLRAELPGPRGRIDAALAVTPAAPTAEAAPGPDARPRTGTTASPASAPRLAGGRASDREPDRVPDRLLGRAPGHAPDLVPDLVPAGPVPADARRQTLAFDGSPERVYSFARPAPDGRPAAHVEVRLHAPAGRPVTVRAWAVDGAAHDPALLQEIVDGIEFPAR